MKGNRKSKLNKKTNFTEFDMIPFVSLLTRECLFLLFASVFILLAMSAIYVDVYFMYNALHENSVTEILQEIILAGIAVLFFWCATKRPEIRGGLILIGGFYLCMLIRELDDIFDMIRHGSWLWFALTTAVVCIALSALIPASTVTGLTDFIQHRSWLMTAMGLIIILIFSRIFGMNQLWEHLMSYGYNREVKNLAEEATELLGYSVCFLSSALYLGETREKFTALRKSWT
ncbi:MULTISPECIES: hypothetical protein [unclassified Erwinia]|uniref:hypothetical protein n=1 Tax=unclassified Erwinia TaxID=2622719 RepID=UPI001EF009AA|nr:MULTISPECIES: hypothetical protein [unclassified Erwinia]